MSFTPTAQQLKDAAYINANPLATVGNVGNSRSRESELERISGAYSNPQNDPYNPVRPTGSVLGANSGGGSNFNKMDKNASVDDSKYWWDAANGWTERENPDDARRREENRIRGIISSGFGQYRSQLKGMIPNYQQSKDQQKQNVATGYESIFQGLRDAKTAGMSNLDTSREQVGARKEESIADIQNNMRDVIRASQMKLGAMGAGDSSASEVMAPFAFTKLAGEQSASVQNQANQQNFEIDKQVADTENMFQQLMSQSEQEKINKMSEIETTYDSYIKNIEERIAVSPREEAEALANLAQGFASQKIAELSQIAAEDRAMKQRIQEWGTNRMAQLNDYKLSMSQSSNFSPRAMAYSELTPFSGGNVSGGETYWNPQALKRKEDGLA